MKRKWWVLDHPPYSPSIKREVVTRVETDGDRPPEAEENPWSRYRQRLGGQTRPRAHYRYIHVKEEHERGSPDPRTVDDDGVESVILSSRRK